MIYIVKGFGIVNKTEIDVFLELSCFFDDPVDIGNLISGFSAFSKTSLNIWKFMVHVLLEKPGLENFEHYFTSVWDECNFAVFWAFFGISFLWDWSSAYEFRRTQSIIRASLLAQMVKRLPAMRETWVQSLGWEDSPGEQNGNPLQYSCLEN